MAVKKEARMAARNNRRMPKELTAIMYLEQDEVRRRHGYWGDMRAFESVIELAAEDVIKTWRFFRGDAEAAEAGKRTLETLYAYVAELGESPS